MKPVPLAAELLQPVVAPEFALGRGLKLGATVVSYHHAARRPRVRSGARIETFDIAQNDLRLRESPQSSLWGAD